MSFLKTFHITEFLHIDLEPLFWNAPDIPKSGAGIIDFIDNEKDQDKKICRTSDKKKSALHADVFEAHECEQYCSGKDECKRMHERGNFFIAQVYKSVKVIPFDRSPHLFVFIPDRGEHNRFEKSVEDAEHRYPDHNKLNIFTDIEIIYEENKIPHRAGGNHGGDRFDEHPETFEGYDNGLGHLVHIPIL